MLRRHAFTAEGVRYDRGARRHAAGLEAPTRPPLGDDERREDAAVIAVSLRATQARLAAAIASRCECGAAPGSLCWDEPLSGVRGLCRERYARGVVSTMLTPPRHPEELAELAAATRNARRDARLRLARRHPNRHPLREGEVAR